MSNSGIKLIPWQEELLSIVMRVDINGTRGAGYFNLSAVQDIVSSEKELLEPTTQIVDSLTLAVLTSSNKPTSSPLRYILECYGRLNDLATATSLPYLLQLLLNQSEHKSPDFNKALLTLRHGLVSYAILTTSNYDMYDYEYPSDVISLPGGTAGHRELYEILLNSFRGPKYQVNSSQSSSGNLRIPREFFHDALRHFRDLASEASMKTSANDEFRAFFCPIIRELVSSLQQKHRVSDDNPYDDLVERKNALKIRRNIDIMQATNSPIPGAFQEPPIPDRPSSRAPNYNSCTLMKPETFVPQLEALDMLFSCEQQFPERPSPLVELFHHSQGENGRPPAYYYMSPPSLCNGRYIETNTLLGTLFSIGPQRVDFVLPDGFDLIALGMDLVGAGDAVSAPGMGLGEGDAQIAASIAGMFYEHNGGNIGNPSNSILSGMGDLGNMQFPFGRPSSSPSPVQSSHTASSNPKRYALGSAARGCQTLLRAKSNLSRFTSVREAFRFYLTQVGEVVRVQTESLRTHARICNSIFNRLVKLDRAGTFALCGALVRSSQRRKTDGYVTLTPVAPGYDTMTNPNSATPLIPEGGDDRNRVFGAAAGHTLHAAAVALLALCEPFLRTDNPMTARIDLRWLSGISQGAIKIPNVSNGGKVGGDDSSGNGSVQFGGRFVVDYDFLTRPFTQVFPSEKGAFDAAVARQFLEMYAPAKEEVSVSSLSTPVTGGVRQVEDVRNINRQVVAGDRAQENWKAAAMDWAASLKAADTVSTTLRFGSDATASTAKSPPLPSTSGSETLSYFNSTQTPSGGRISALLSASSTCSDSPVTARPVLPTASNSESSSGFTDSPRWGSPTASRLPQGEAERSLDAVSSSDVASNNTPSSKSKKKDSFESSLELFYALPGNVPPPQGMQFHPITELFGFTTCMLSLSLHPMIERQKLSSNRIIGEYLKAYRASLAVLRSPAPLDLQPGARAAYGPLTDAFLQVEHLSKKFEIFLQEDLFFASWGGSSISGCCPVPWLFGGAYANQRPDGVELCYSAGEDNSYRGWECIFRFYVLQCVVLTRYVSMEARDLCPGACTPDEYYWGPSRWGMLDNPSAIVNRGLSSPVRNSPRVGEGGSTPREDGMTTPIRSIKARDGPYTAERKASQLLPFLRPSLPLPPPTDLLAKLPSFLAADPASFLHAMNSLTTTSRRAILTSPLLRPLPSTAHSDLEAILIFLTAMLSSPPLVYSVHDRMALLRALALFMPHPSDPVRVKLEKSAPTPSSMLSPDLALYPPVYSTILTHEWTCKTLLPVLAQLHVEVAFAGTHNVYHEKDEYRLEIGGMMQFLYRCSASHREALRNWALPKRLMNPIQRHSTDKKSGEKEAVVINKKAEAFCNAVLTDLDALMFQALEHMEQLKRLEMGENVTATSNRNIPEALRRMRQIQEYMRRNGGNANEINLNEIESIDTAEGTNNENENTVEGDTTGSNPNTNTETGAEGEGDAREQLTPQQLRGTIQSYLVFSQTQLSLLAAICSGLSDVFMSDALIDKLAASLGLYLDKLCGKDRNKLKFSNMSDSGFNPRKLVFYLATIYTDMARVRGVLSFSNSSSSTSTVPDMPDSIPFANSVGIDGFLSSIVRDERSFHVSNFHEAARVLRDPKTLQDYPGSLEVAAQLDALVPALQHAEAVNKKVESSFADAPEDTIDVLLSELIRDPVLLPSSQLVMARSVALRTLLSYGNKDPYTNIKTVEADLISLKRTKLAFDQWFAMRSRLPPGRDADFDKQCDELVDVLRDVRDAEIEEVMAEKKERDAKVAAAKAAEKEKEKLKEEVINQSQFSEAPLLERSQGRDAPETSDIPNSTPINRTPSHTETQPSTEEGEEMDEELARAIALSLQEDSL